MKISTSMLKRYYKKDISLEELKKVTNEHITEVESLERLVNTDLLVVGHVNEVIKHPNADKLFVCQVDLGNGEVEQIVCGGYNVKAGQYVCVAKVGALLPGDFLIKSSMIRGFESNGMICSLEELGFDSNMIPEKFKGGIYYFDEPKPLGSNALEALNLDQATLELDLTPNRADLLSVLGFTYDLGAATNVKIDTTEPEVTELGPDNPLTVNIENNDCKRYYARYIDQIEVKPSPLWMQADLLASGIRPINNVVDITNYVLLEYGTPLHAFDAHKFKTQEIVVKKAQDLEEVISLDEQIRILKSEDVVITNGHNVTAIGGVMGLFNTRVNQDTTAIILEAASFNSEAIRKTSRRLDLISDSSLRFERGIDETRVRKALNRASQLLVELAGGRVYKGITFDGESFDKPITITLDALDVNKYLGTHFNKQDIKNILQRLNIFEAKPDNYLIPTYRNDLKIKADLIEEIARIYGYNNIPTTYPKTELIGSYTEKQVFINSIRDHFVSLGFNEVINYSLISKDKIDLFKDPSKDIVSLLHPMREDRAVLRHSLINGLVDNVNYHLARQQDNLRFFEVGNLYYTEHEPISLAGIIIGRYIDGLFTNNTTDSSYYLIKGLLETVFKKYHVELNTVKIDHIKGLHPGVGAYIKSNDKTLGIIGKIHPSILKDAYVFEMDLDLFYELTENQQDFKAFSKYPSVTRDLAIIVDKNIPVSKLMELIKQTTRRYLTDLKVFDIYEDEILGENNISIAFSLTFNALEKTLQTEDVDKLIKSVVFRLEKEYNAKIRQ